MPKRLAAAAAAALGLAASAVAAAPSANADVPCTIAGITPTTVVVGISPTTKRFGVRTVNCDTVEHWSINDNNPDSFMYVYTSAPYQTFSPSDNREAGAHNVTVEVSNGDYFTSARTFTRGYYLKRYAAFQKGTFNASPEPVGKGKKITVKGRILLADWTADRYRPAQANVQVQFRTPTGSYRTVKTVRAASTGWVSTTVTVSRTGVWRLYYPGNAIASSAVTTGDGVKVK